MTSSVSYCQATAVKATSTHTYSAEFPDDWCIGNVPHGGFVTSTFLRVASTHFSKTHSSLKQPHTITLHLSFLRRTQVGPAIFTVYDTKLGRQTSTIQIILTQPVNHPATLPLVVGYITQSNLSTFSGPSFKTEWSIHPPPAPFPTSTALASNTDPNWAELSRELPFATFRKASRQCRFYFPRTPQRVKGQMDQWLALRSGEAWDDTGIGFISDMFPQLVESIERPSLYDLEQPDTPISADKSVGSSKYWFPTLLLNLDIKKSLPPNTYFLFTRVLAKRIQSGRYDLEVIIMDEGRDVVALSNHVCLVLPAGRNLAKRRQKVDGEETTGGIKL